MTIAGVIRKIINPLGVDITKYPNSDLSRRISLFNHFKIDKILDVGANVGQYGNKVREIGFKGEIRSFEPLSTAYKQLEKVSSKDKNWKIYNFALGDKEESTEINVSKNLYSSSLLEITSTHTDGAPNSAFEYKETIKVKTLNTVFTEIVDVNDVVFLKLDVQGFEENVLKGANEVLSKIKGVQIEMSLVELYKGEMLYLEVIALLESHGFQLYSLENGFYDKSSGRLLQVDGLFFRDIL